MPVTVRRATKKDAARVAELSVALAEQHVGYDTARFARLITRDGAERFYGGQAEAPDAVVLVAERDGEVVGFAYMQYEPVLYAELALKVACLHDIFVDENERRSDIGKKLLETAADEARGFGATKVLLSVATQNDGAKAFFESVGFYTTMHEMMCLLD